jgi:hypothetical protein
MAGTSKRLSDFHGDMNNLRVYKISGVDKTIIARKGGPSSEEVKNGANYADLRKNQQEFAAASNLAKTLRHSLPKKMAKICEPYVSGKLTAEFRNLAKLSDGTKGKRPILLSENGQSLEGFDFNSNAPFKKIFPTNVMVMSGSNYGQLILHIPAFIPKEDLNAPDQATHYQLFSHLLLLSDFTYKQDAKEYNPCAPEVHARKNTMENPIHPIINYPEESTTQQLSVYDGEALPKDTRLLLILGVKFYKYDKLKYLDLPSNSSMQIIKVV